jgi:hypothetical protein
MNEPDLARALETAQARLQSARLLWRGGRLADAYAYGAQGLRALASGWGDGGSLAAAGYRELAELEQTLATIAVLPAPGSDTDFGRAHQRGLERACAAAEQLAAFTSRRLRSPAQRRARVRRRLSIGLLAAAALAITGLRLWRHPVVSASAVYSAEFPASQAADGIAATEWLLPGGRTGWLELGFRSPRQVRGVRLLNSHNRSYRDRATRRFRVTAFAGLRSLASAEGELEAIGTSTTERRIALEAGGVTRIRVEILSYFGAGGGLAEVEVE